DAGVRAPAMAGQGLSVTALPLRGREDVAAGVKPRCETGAVRPSFLAGPARSFGDHRNSPANATQPAKNSCRNWPLRAGHEGPFRRAGVAYAGSAAGTPAASPRKAWSPIVSAQNRWGFAARTPERAVVKAFRRLHKLRGWNSSKLGSLHSLMTPGSWR